MRRYDNLEVIVVDGGSRDKTVVFAKQFPIKVIGCTKNRALQMNKAAEVAGGEVFLFLHADCQLEQGCWRQLSKFYKMVMWEDP